MKKSLLISLIIICISTGIVLSQSIERYSAQEIKADLEYLRSTMEDANYNFYARTSKTTMDKAFTSIMNSIDDSLTKKQVFRLFQPYVALANMSHCSMKYPWEEYFGVYMANGGTVFPLRLYFDKDKVFVRNNFSNNTFIEENDEIIAFNGSSMSVMMEKMYQYIAATTRYYKNSLIEQMEYSRLYWFFFERREEFKIKLRKKDGEELDLTVQSIPASEFETKLRKQASLFRYHREFKLFDDIAYLHPGGFANGNVKFDPMDPLTWDNTEFCQFIDSTFTYFREAGVKKLIIDLRYNPGGDNSFSDYLISYLTSRVITSKISIKTSQITKDYWKKSEVTEHQELKNKILSHKNGEYFEYTIGKIIPHPDSVRFKGKVYVLINRYSLSNSMGVAAIMQDNEIGKIVGEETAEIVGAFGASHMFKLPNTKLSVQYPKSGTRLNDDITPRGVIPDYPIEEDIFTDTDDVLEYTLKLIKQN